MTTTRSKRQPFEKVDRFVVFTVEGRGEFPIDMLRYDLCWPAHEPESHKIKSFPFTDEHADEHAKRTTPRQVDLKGIKFPTETRWQSMGWRVVKIEKVR